AGNSGDAISLVCIDEHDYLLAIEKLIKQKINKIAIEGFKVNPNIKAEPISNGRNRAKSGANRATQSRASKTEDKTSSSKRTFGRKRDEEKSSSSEKPRGNSNRFGSKRGETSSITSRSKRVSSSLKNK
ncbi:hypothetical protein AS859_07370, partial [Aliarcobacter cryaerophilus]